MLKHLLPVGCLLAPALAIADEPPAAQPPAVAAIEDATAARPGAALGFRDPIGEPAVGEFGDDYDLFHAVPGDHVRPLAIDDTPTTIDAGHLQAEIDLAVVGYHRDDAARVLAAQVMPTRLRVGLTQRVEAQLVVVPYHREQTELADATTAVDGYGSTTGRLKLNLWGNDGGRTAAALVPFVGKAGDAWTGGLAVPGTVAVARAVIGIVPQVDVCADGATFSTTANVSHPLAGPVIGVAEAAGRVDTMGSPWALQANAAVAVGVNDDTELDAGVRRGVVGDVPDVEGFVRISVRR